MAKLQAAKDAADARITALERDKAGLQADLDQERAAHTALQKVRRLFSLMFSQKNS